MDFLVATAENEIRTWLEDKPWEWSQVITARTSLRAMYNLGYSSSLWLNTHGLIQFRALSLAWTACNWPMLLVPEVSVDEAVEAANAAVSDSAPAAASAAHAAHATLYASPDGASTNLGIIMDIIDPEIEYNNIKADFAWLETNHSYGDVTRLLSQHVLWPDKRPNNWDDATNETRLSLLAIDSNYSVWIDWYERRVRGERAAFDILGDKGRVEDKKILRRLAEATDEDFWGKGHEYVNATLKGWLDEARERVRPRPVHHLQATDVSTGPPEISAATLGIVQNGIDAVSLPPQEPTAITYGINTEGKLDRLPHSDQAKLRDTPDQRRAYDDLRAAVLALREEGQRLGPRLLRAVERFAASLPERFEDAETYPIWRDANALRRLNRAHIQASKSADPDEAKLEPVIAETLGGLLDLYNHFAFADDGLREKDQQRISPQERADAAAEAAAAKPLIEAILNTPDIATDRALYDLNADTEITELPQDDPYAGQVLAQANSTKRNFFSAVLDGVQKASKNPQMVGHRLAKGTIEGAGKAIGGGAVGLAAYHHAELLQFIATFAVILQHYVAIAFPTFEHLPDLIERIRLYWLSRKS